MSTGGPRTEKELVRAGLAGDPESRVALMERLLIVPRALREINRRRGSRLSEQDVEDLTQEVLIAVWKKLPRFTIEGTLDAWLVRFCQLDFMNYSRSHERRRRQLDRLLRDSDPAETSTGALGDQESPADERVQRAMANLPELQQTVIRLRHEDGMTFQAIAERLDESIEAIKARYYRSLRGMRDSLLNDHERGDAS